MREQLHRISLIIVSIFILAACKPGTVEPGMDNSVPTNLVIETTVSTDGTGNVDFRATANNAVSYDFEFGDGVIKTGTNGKVTYQYTLAGTNNFTVRVTAKSASGASIKKTTSIDVTVEQQTSGLIWSDEFDIDGAPNPEKWGYDIGGGGWGNGESQYYTNRSSNVIVKDGVLKITAIKETIESNEYSSARILSKGKFDFKYGRVEARAKLPSAKGTWPAIWMLGSNFSEVGWPDCGEIDIMEHVGNDLNKIHGTLHYPGRSGGNANTGSKTFSNVSTEFHVYGLEWDASIIKMTVDGQTVHTVANNSSIPFNHNFFFILNVAMGGTFGGAIDPNFQTDSMEIDYIRVYK